MEQYNYTCKRCGKKCFYNKAWEFEVNSFTDAYYAGLCKACLDWERFKKFAEDVEKNTKVKKGKTKCFSCGNTTEAVQEIYPFGQKSEWFGECHNCGSRFETSNVWDISED